MSVKSLREKVKELELTLPLMEGREKADFDDIKGTVVTIDDYGFMKDGDKEYVAFTIKEDDKHFYFGGMVLTDNIQTLDNDGYGDSIREEGLPVKFGTKKGKNKKNYTTVEFYPGE